MFFKKKKKIQELEREIKIVRENFERDRGAKLELQNELEKYKELYVSTLGRTLNNSIAQSNKVKDDLEALNEGWKIELKKKNKIINAMASYISRFDNDETICKGIDCYDQIYGCRTCIKQYFERKVKDE